VYPCIRASPEIPIVHAGPALGLQELSGMSRISGVMISVNRQTGLTGLCLIGSGMIFSTALAPSFVTDLPQQRMLYCLYSAHWSTAQRCIM
jgi:hypothetical protein